MVEAEILKDRSSRDGRVMPVEADDFAAKDVLYLPETCFLGDNMLYFAMHRQYKIGKEMGC